MAKRGIKALAKKVEDVWDELRKGHIEVGRAKELFNGAGKVINCKKIELEYKQVKDKDPQYRNEYLEDNEEQNITN